MLRDDCKVMEGKERPFSLQTEPSALIATPGWLFSDTVSNLKHGVIELVRLRFSLPARIAFAIPALRQRLSGRQATNGGPRRHSTRGRRRVPVLMIVETADRLRKSVGRFSSFNDVKIGQHAIGPHQEARSHHPRCFDPTDAVAEAAKPAQEATIIDEPRLTRHQQPPLLGFSLEAFSECTFTSGLHC
jgi:hypothetical protein